MVLIITIVYKAFAYERDHLKENVYAEHGFVPEKSFSNQQQHPQLFDVENRN